MDNPPQLLLEDLMYPLMEVRTNSTHDVQGDRAGTQLQYGQQIQKLENAPNRFGLMVSVRTDNATSKNPPYNFVIEAYGIFTVNNLSDPEAMSKFVFDNGLPMIVGAIRERLADMTARAPWGRFLINTVNLSEARSVTCI